MSDYFIKYKNLAIWAQESRKLIRDKNFKCKVISSDSDNTYDKLRYKNPYAQCVKIQIDDMSNLKLYIPINLKLNLLNIPEVQSLIRDDKINKIIND